MKDLFALTSESLDPLVLERLRGWSFPEAGGLVSFEGRVRNHHDGKPVLKLSYSVYEELALAEGKKIVQEALDKYGLVAAFAAHRFGELGVGDAAVWVGAWAAHRSEAFEAARYMIDEIKHRLPIWKEEYYGDGSHDWVYCKH